MRSNRFAACWFMRKNVGESESKNESSLPGFRQPFRLVKRCRISLLDFVFKTVNS